jgi:hypothetical protein
MDAFIPYNIGRHSVVDSDITELIDALQRRKRRESGSQHHYQLSPALSMFSQKNKMNANKTDSLKSSPGTSSSHRTSSAGIGTDSEYNSPKTTFNTDASSSASCNDPPATEQTLTYDKLKHFLTTCEHSQEIIEKLEDEFKLCRTEILASHKKSDDTADNNDTTFNLINESLA